MVPRRGNQEKIIENTKRDVKRESKYRDKKKYKGEKRIERQRKSNYRRREKKGEKKGRDFYVCVCVRAHAFVGVCVCGRMKI